MPHRRRPVARVGRSRRAEEAQRCLRHWPDHPRLLLLAARAARCDGDLAEADRQLDGCQRLGGDPRAVSLERALLVARQGRPAEVEGCLLACLREGPPDADFILEALARGYLLAQRLPEAQDCLDRWLALQPDCAPALLWRGQVMEWWNDLEEAVASSRRAFTAASACG